MNTNPYKSPHEPRKPEPRDYGSYLLIGMFVLAAIGAVLLIRFLNPTPEPPPLQPDDFKRVQRGGNDMLLL